MNHQISINCIETCWTFRKYKEILNIIRSQSQLITIDSIIQSQGVVLYEVSRMRQGNYTEDTLRAAKIGLEKGHLEKNSARWSDGIV